MKIQNTVRDRLRLAVTAPWCVELEKNILVVVKDEVVVVVGNDNGDRALLLLWDGLGLDAGLDLSGNEVINKLANVLSGNLLGLLVGELLVLVRLLDGEGGPLANLEVEVAGVLAEGLGVDGSEVDHALVFGSDGFKFLSKLLALLRSLSKDVSERNTSLYDVREMPIILER